ncbi:MAG: hypothetical protein ACR2NL_02700, partial [Acidimicrobiia bacterium]
MKQVVSLSPPLSSRIDLVIDSVEGHRPFYLRLCLLHGQSIGATCTVHAPGSEDDLAEHDRDLLDLATWRFVSDPASLDYLSAIETDRIVLLDGDALGRSTFSRRKWRVHAPLIALSLRGQRPRWNPSLVRFAKSVARFVMTQRLKRRPEVRVITLASSSDRVGPADDAVQDAVPIDCSPEDVERFRAEVLAEAETAGRTRFWIGIVGIINHRKNVKLVARALAAATADGQLRSPGLLLAGPIAEDTKSEVNAAMTLLDEVGIPVVTLDRLLDDSTFDAAIGALDAVVVAYSNDGPSGVLNKAARLGTRVVAAGSPTLRSDVRDLGLGAWGKLTVDGIEGALVATASQPPPQPVEHLGVEHFGARLLGPDPMRILAWPAFRHRWANPYTSDLADGLVALGNEVIEFGLGRQLLHHHDAILLHWPEFAPTHRSRVVRYLASPVVLIVLFAHQVVGGASLVWTVHNVQPHQDPSPRLRRWFMRTLTSRVDGVIALNQTSLTEATALYPALATTSHLLTRIPAFDQPAVPKMPDGITESAMRNFVDDLPPTTRLVLAWGKMEPYKQLDELADAAIDLGDGFMTLIAGRCDDAALEARLRSRADAHPDRLTVIAGHIDDGELARSLSRASVAAFNFRAITNSASMIASLSAETPVVAPAHPSLGELQADIGDDWIRLFEGPLDASILRTLVDAPR